MIRKREYVHPWWESQLFYNLNLDVICHCFHCILLVRSESIGPAKTKVKEITQMPEYQEVGILCGHPRACLPHHLVNSGVPKGYNSKQVGEFNFISIRPPPPCFHLNWFPSNAEMTLSLTYLYCIPISHSSCFLFILVSVSAFFFFSFPFFSQSPFTGLMNLKFSISRAAISSWNRKLPLGLVTLQLLVWHTCLFSLICGFSI